MKLKAKYKINTQSDLIYCKVEIQNILKNAKEKEFFLFALLELGKNILKYAKTGEIWLLESNGSYLLGVLDRGDGIENLEWALKKGTTSSSNSLGLGLFSVKNKEGFVTEIFTSTSNPSGTVILIKPKDLNADVLSFGVNYMDLKHSGDLIVSKRKYYLIADASGHGLKAYKSAEVIKEEFLNTKISCVTINEFFAKLHKMLKSQKLRSAVMAIAEVLKKEVLVCGVGNIGVVQKSDEIKEYSLQKGIVGEIFHKNSLLTLKREGKILLFTDGIDTKIVYNVLKKTESIYLIALASVFFSKDVDDKSILIIGEKNEQAV
ncbi:MAG: hypothetical protein GXO62_00835 [Epsilonproteobacteria bacterium]|nr:hypothetical protein [Campylobacterota bacterium]